MIMDFINFIVYLSAFVCVVLMVKIIVAFITGDNLFK